MQLINSSLEQIKKLRECSVWKCFTEKPAFAIQELERKAITELNLAASLIAAKVENEPIDS